MNRMYQFYTFIPLVTFWFVCAYIVMAMFPRISVHIAREHPFQMVYIFIKLCVFLGFAIALSTSQTLFEKVFMFKLWKYLFVNSDDLVSEWRDRWNLDAYSFLIGMSFGLLMSALKAFNIIDNSDDVQIELEESSTELRDKRREKNLPTHIKFFFILTSVTGLVSYAVFANLCTSKEGCNQYIAYITVIPVRALSFFFMYSFVCAIINLIRNPILDHFVYHLAEHDWFPEWQVQLVFPMDRQDIAGALHQLLPHLAGRWLQWHPGATARLSRPECARGHVHIRMHSAWAKQDNQGAEPVLCTEQLAHLSAQFLFISNDPAADCNQVRLCLDSRVVLFFFSLYHFIKM